MDKWEFPPSVSVIIPVYNRARELQECLRALQNQTLRPSEVIVVDDRSSDDSAEVARKFGATVLRAQENLSANYCRNLGAKCARGEILMFVDSDTVPSHTAVAAAVARFGDDSIDAVVGLYSAQHRHQNVTSQYKNLWIRYSYTKSAGRIDWIFGAVSAIRTQSFRRVGGFDHTMMMTHGGEDLELGKRMARNNLNILLDPGCEVEHLRQYRLKDLFLNDLRRSDGFVRVAFQIGQLAGSVRKGFVNVYPSFVYSVFLSWMMVLSAGAALVAPRAVWVILFSTVLYSILNVPFLSYFYRHRGGWQTVQAGVVLVVDHLACGAGVVIGIVKALLSGVEVIVSGRRKELEGKGK